MHSVQGAGTAHEIVDLQTFFELLFGVNDLFLVLVLLVLLLSTLLSVVLSTLLLGVVLRFLLLLTS